MRTTPATRIGWHEANTGYHRPPLAIAVPGVLLVSALGLYAVHLLLRPIGIKPASFFLSMFFAGVWTPGDARTGAMLTVTALCVGLAARFFRWE